jgi:2-oxo-4-hydroxy-4-carboxy-5-ureidoimidazoline decarboxylase
MIACQRGDHAFRLTDRTKMTLDEVNELSAAAFMQVFGTIAEHSPWVADQAMAARPYPSREAAIDAFQEAVAQAPRTTQYALVQAHPDLAGRAALAGELEAASLGEQAAAGLGTLTVEEMALFQLLNSRYRERFGFPFILAVKGAGKARILDAFKLRVDGGREEEFLTALAQVMRIMRFRLEDRIDG